MIRTQISLTEEQMARLRDAAARRGVSMAAVVRDAVDAALEDDPEDGRRRWTRALQAVGSHRSGDAGQTVSVARDHDAYLADTYARAAERGVRRRAPA